ncbi:biosynthetic-type acetolactate synthase large subunit, partial [Candidatus Ruminimicrobium bovinum]|uniref:biosynthetic-type acetolactate synthase large subunit n=1 Tax=Candidatus Ruminimicrobium bovinum TaxID=3242779 RepID=UPI0039B902A4
SIPMVAITGNVPTSLIGKDSFQEINITGVTLPITKHNYFVSKIEELADTIREAFKIAKSGRPGPVLIDIPKDVQVAEYDFEFKGTVESYKQKKTSDKQIETAIELIDKAQKPYIYIGGGVITAGISKEVKKLAEKIDGYIGCTFMGLSAIENSYQRFLGMQGMHGQYESSMANKEADLVIGIGVRFSDRATGNVKKYSKNAKIIQLDIDSSEINKNIKADAGIAGDIKYTISKILQKCKKQKHHQWEKLITDLKIKSKEISKKINVVKSNKIRPKQIFDIINKIKNKNTVIATDVGQHQMWAAQWTKFEFPRKFVSSGGLGTMGFGLGAAIGACIGDKNKTILITGDGSFGMNLNELATAVSYKIPVIIVVINNGVLGMVRQWQTLFYGKRYSNTVLARKTDFVKLADAFGLKGERVTTAEQFENALKKAFKTNFPYIIDTVIDMDEFVLPMLPPGGSIEDIITEKQKI